MSIEEFEVVDLPNCKGPNELHVIELNDEKKLSLPTRFLEAIFPIVFIPGLHSKGNPESLHLTPGTRIIGTGFLVDGEKGLFMTAAHVIPQELMENHRKEPVVATLLFTNSTTFDIIPIIDFCSDRDHDVGIGYLGNLQRSSHPVPFFPKLARFLTCGEMNGLFVCVGYQDTIYSDISKIELQPPLFVGHKIKLENKTRRVEDSFGNMIDVKGPFLKTSFQARPGTSGGPLFGFKNTAVANEYQVEVMGIVSHSTVSQYVNPETYSTLTQTALKVSLTGPHFNAGGKSLGEVWERAH